MNFEERHKPKSWQIVFITIGILATLITILKLFVIVSPQKTSLELSSEISINDDSLLLTLEKFSDGSIVNNGDVEILNNGDEFYPSLYKDISEAKESISFSVYIWKPGEISDEIFALLTRKAREGLSVRLLLDGFGAKGVPKDNIKILEDAGGKVSWFHPTSFTTITKYHKRNHVRAIIIDKSISYTGGMAVSDYWSGSADDKDHWRDMMFRITGAPVSMLEKTFVNLWEIASGEVLVTNNENQTSSKNTTNSSIKAISLTSLSPDQDTEQMSTHFALSINAAKESVIITTPYLVLEKRVERSLIDAANRGVKVTILLPGPIIDSKVVQSATQHYYTRLLKSNINIYEYQPTMIHSKYMVIDGTLSIIGSANMDTRSTYFNIENIMSIQNADLGSRLTSVFKQDLEKSKQITYEKWQKRTLFRRLFELSASAIDKQL